MRFTDQVVVVTGAGQGIGLATARLAAREGAKVAVCDRDPGSVSSTVARIREEGGVAIGVCGDVSNLTQVRANVDEVMQAYGRIDVLINNAGILKHTPARLVEEAQWRREIDVCLTGAFFWAQTAAVASMIPRKQGAIVNLGSGAAVAGAPGSTSYCAAKHGVVGLTRALCVEWGQYNIRVNCVCPGITATEMTMSVARDYPERIRQREQRIPLGHMAQPDDQAKAILFLASSDAASISGHILSVDGGTAALSSGYSAPRDGH
ncbi:SDR family NAD(P)-dependent oxidoreductase [Variovorax saccharolyticus]|uniref:SDR family NAD(P)-dependent oxidoreductase n=1 Tax=Variovorax saccharolyticus TaxID=3053516 RepID=UPI00257677BE|nr:SDR family NAD(P)-dependent oxidoreductase [Variovorax sp. J22R187]MDM0022203.1 SDR family NAD(P)-dependent oxidoreductase [Variovorax sp. J22R187]